MWCATTIVKYLVLISNLVFALAGLALLIVGIVLKLSDVTKIVPAEFSLAPILCIIIGVIVFVTAFLGFYGAMKESTCMLTSYAIILLTIFIIQVAIGVYVFLQVKELQSQITKNVLETFENRFKNQEANETLHVTQQLLHCCGVYGPDDYNGQYPHSCCPNTSLEHACPSPNNELFYDGCTEKLTHDLKSKLKLIGGVVIGVAAIEIILAVFGLCLACSIRNS